MSLVGIVLKSGLINQASGSAYIETERTKIACAVLVPLDPMHVVPLINRSSAMVLDSPKVTCIMKMEGLMLKSNLRLSRRK